MNRVDAINLSKARELTRRHVRAQHFWDDDAAVGVLAHLKVLKDAAHHARGCTQRASVYTLKTRTGTPKERQQKKYIVRPKNVQHHPHGPL